MNFSNNAMQGGMINPQFNNSFTNTMNNGRMNYGSYTAPQSRSMNLSGGRMIQDESEIMPNEIPMDGNVGVFVQKDLQQIFLKTWGGNGAVLTNRYVLVDENSPVKEDQNPLNLIMDRLTSIENFLMTPQTNRQQGKKNMRNNNGQTNQQNNVAGGPENEQNCANGNK